MSFWEDPDVGSTWVAVEYISLQMPVCTCTVDRGHQWLIWVGVSFHFCNLEASGRLELIEHVGLGPSILDD